MKNANRPVFTVWDKTSPCAFGWQAPAGKSSIVSFTQLSDAEYVARCVEDFRCRACRLPQPAELRRPPLTLRAPFTLEIRRHTSLFDLIDACAPVGLDVDFCHAVDGSKGDVRFTGTKVLVEDVNQMRLYWERLYLKSLFNTS